MSSPTSDPSFVPAHDTRGRLYSSRSFLSTPGSLFRSMFADLAASRELAFRLTVRDFKAQFRVSFAGYLWAFIPPLVASATFLLLRQGNVINFPDTEIRYSVFVFVGTMLWQAFVEALNSPIRMIEGSRTMLIKVNFPRESLLLAAIFLSLINLAIRVVILIPFLLWLHPPSHAAVLLFPFAAALLVLLGFTIGLLLAPLGMLYHDIQRGLTLITTFWMFITPVVFPLSGHGLVRQIVLFNPVTPVLQTARDWLVGTDSGLVLEMFWVAGGILVFLPVGWLCYRIFMPHIIERLGM